MSRFLYRNLRGYRALVAFAVSLTFVQVTADILTAFPLKFILDKIVHHTDPVVPLVGGLIFQVRPAGHAQRPQRQRGPHPDEMVIFSTVLLSPLGDQRGALYIQVLIAARVGANLSARLRARLFEHLQHLSLDSHGGSAPVTWCSASPATSSTSRSW